MVLTYEKAKREVIYLSRYINLIDNYKIEVLDDWIIHQYAIHSSVSKVIRNSKNENSVYFSQLNFDLLNPSYIKDLIMSPPKDELHKLIKKEFLIKTRPQRRKKYN